MSSSNRAGAAAAIAQDIGGTAAAPTVEGLQGEDLPDSVASTLLKRNAANNAWETVVYTGSNLDTSLSGKAASSHAHAQADVTDLVDDLAAKASTTHATAHVTGGADVIASAVAGGDAGLMTGADKTKVDGLVAVTTKGDLVTFSTVPAKLGVGTDGYVLTADAAATNGIKWAEAAGGGTQDIDAYRQVGTSPLECWYPAGAFQPASNLTARLISADTLYAMPYLVTRAVTVDRLAINVTTPSASSAQNMRAGIYTATSTANIYPNALVLDAGTFNANTSGVQTLTISQALTAGTLYWFVLTTSVADVTVRALSSMAAPTMMMGTSSALGTSWNCYLEVARSFATLPGTFTSSAAFSANNFPAVFMRFSA